MIRKILLSILTIVAPIFLIASTAKAAEAFKWEQDLKQAIQQEGLDQFIPKELSNCDGSGDTAKMWLEFMKGLSYIESSWDEKKNNPSDAKGTPSRGLFQMTGGDTALGQNCFGTKDPKSKEPFDAKKNINCAVKKMKELVSGQGSKGKTSFATASLGGSFGSGGSAKMAGSLKEQASKYWGPLKPGNGAHAKAEKLMNDVASNCGTQAFEPSVIEGGGQSPAGASGGSGKGGRN